MNAGMVMSIHGPLEGIAEKYGGNLERQSEFFIIKKFSEKFDKVFIFSTDKKSCERLLPKNFIHVRLYNRFLHLFFGWLIVLYYALRYDLKILYTVGCASLPAVFMVNKLSGAWVHLTYNYTWFASRHGFQRIFLKTVEKLLINFVDSFVVHSEEIRNFVSGKNVLPIKKGIVLASFDPAKVKRHPVYKKIKGKTLVYSGWLSPIKDPVTMIKAYRLAKREIPDLHLIMAGDGELREECEKLADKDVHFMSYVEDIPGLLKGADVFVLSSVYDASPRSLMEAMAMGLPSIATDVGGVSDYLDKETGILVESGNPGLFAEKIVYLLKNPKLARSMGGHARRKMLKNHDLGKNLDALMIYLKKQIGGGKSRNR
jgi:glycosyltransferase involved in cell wall biosynthesis